MLDQRLRIRRRREVLTAAPDRAGRPTACAAPDLQLHFAPDGDVSACCRNSVPLGNVGEHRLADIWDGPARAALAARLAADDFSAGCDACGLEITTEGRPHSFAEQYDRWAEVSSIERLDPAWPVRMDFNLSNACNLQCIQCSGEFSTSIRLHRERRPPLPKPYGDAFFEDLRAFLPHLRHAAFAGGEPFLAPENFRLWDLIAEVAPDLECTICTNATRWNAEVAAVVDRLRPSMIFSLDGFSAETFEAIRVGADHGEVMANVERFSEATRRNGKALEINVCVMPQNVHELADLALFAEARSMLLTVSVTRGPQHCSLADLPGGELRAISDELERRSIDVVPRLELNRSTWLAELRRIRTWADRAEDRPTTPSGSISGFPRSGTGPTGDADAVADLRATAPDGRVHRVVVGPDERIREISTELCDVFGVGRDEVIGTAPQALESWFTHRFGPIVGQTTEAEGPDRTEVVVAFTDVRVRIAMVPMRDGAGTADRVHLLVAISG